MLAKEDPATVQLRPVVSRPARVEPEAAGVEVDKDQPVALVSGLSLNWFTQIGLSGSVSFWT
jgi:hypothetical protein